MTAAFLQSIRGTSDHPAWQRHPWILRRAAVLALVLSVPLTLLLVTGHTTISADEPIVDAEELSANNSMLLPPGNHLIGWIGEAKPVGELFDEFPEIVLLYRWNAGERRYQGALAPIRQGSLDQLLPGMAVMVRVAGDKGIEWDLPRQPVRGLVELKPGTNWVAWSGPDGWSVEQVAREIGRSLVSLRTGESVYDPARPETANSFPPIMRGDPLIVTVNHSVNWLQPTNLMPEVKFPGGASPEAREALHDDLATVLAFYADHYGVQADASRFSISVPISVDALIEEFEEPLFYDPENIGLRDLWSRAAGWAGTSIVVRQTYWMPNQNNINAWGRYLLTHEYAHVLQRQLAPTGRSTSWQIEGAANWAQAQHQVLDEQIEWDQHRMNQYRVLTGPDAPTLLQTESGAGTWHYTLGEVAVDWLVEQTDSQAWIEIWRRQTPRLISPNSRWQATPQWESIFHEIFGITVDDFHRHYEERRSELPRDTDATASSSVGGLVISGTLTRVDGTPIPNAFVFAGRRDRGVGVGWGQNSKTDHRGRFEITVYQAGEYGLSANLGEDRSCRVYHRSLGGTDDRQEADLISMSRNDVTDVRFSLAADRCAREIQGNVVDGAGKGLVGLRVEAEGENIHWADTRTGASGRFSMVVPANDNYRLSVELSPGCHVWYRAGSFATATGNRSDRVAIDDSAATGIRVRVPSSVCSRQIQGRIVDRYGEGIDGQWINASGVDGGSGSASSGPDGSFAIQAPAQGDYRLVTWINDCAVYFREDGLATDWQNADLVNVANLDVTEILMRVDPRICSTRITGRVLGANGAGLEGLRVTAVGQEETRWAWTTAAGRFSIILPEAGRYRVRVAARGCVIYYAGTRVVGLPAEAELVVVEEHDTASGINLRIDRDICRTRITGQVVNERGEGIGGQWVEARGRNGSGRVMTRWDGSFDLGALSPGSYRVSVDFEGEPAYLANDRVVQAVSDSVPLEVTESGLSGLEVRIWKGMFGSEVLGSKLEGRLVDAIGQGIGGVLVRASYANRSRSVLTAWDGSFAFGTSNVDQMMISADFDGCRVYYGSAGIGTTMDEAQSINTADGNRPRIVMRVPSGICQTKISGRVLAADGSEIPRVRVSALNDQSLNRGRTSRDGAFSITVQRPGAYRLQVNLGGCSVYWTQDGVVARQADAALVNAVKSDVTGLEVRIPLGTCTLQLRGRLLNENGDAMVGRSVTAHGEAGGYGNAPTWLDGSFAITVPIADDYQLVVSLDGCTIYWGRTEIVTTAKLAELVEVAGADVMGLDLRVPATICSLKIGGKILDADGQGLEGLSVSVNGEGGQSWAWTESDGSFAITLPDAGDYRLQVSLNGCTLYWSEHGVVTRFEDAALVSAVDSDVSGVHLRIPAGTCSMQIRGRVLDEGGQGLAGRWLQARSDVGSVGARTSADGEFAITVPGAGTYTLEVNLNGCRVYWGPTGIATKLEDAARITVAEGDASEVEIRIPSSICSLSISGTLLDESGTGLAGLSVAATGEGPWVSTKTSSDGTFEIVVPTDGSYRLQAEIAYGCWLYQGRTGVVARAEKATMVDVAGSNVAGVQIQIPADMCKRQIVGRLTGLGQDAGTKLWVSAFATSGNAGGSPDASGSFAVVVPAPGQYRLAVTIQGCTYYYRKGVAVRNYSQASTIVISDNDHEGIEFKLPEDRPGSCR